MKFTTARKMAAFLILAFFLAIYLFSESDGIGYRVIGLTSQFSPSLSRFGWCTAIALAWLVAAGFAGRLYCSLFCPAGLLQEISHRFGRLMGTSRLRFRPAPLLRSALIPAILAGLALFFGLAAPVAILEPVGLFGRLAQPLAQLAAAYGSPISLLAVPALVSSVIVLVAVPLFKGRWFCAELCPVGALLRLAATVPAGRRLVVNPEKCVSCGRCEKICQTGCADSRNKRIDSSRCVLCLDCLDVCAPSAIAGARPVPPAAGGRRVAVGRLAALAVGGGFFAFRQMPPILDLAAAADGIVPPGSLSPGRHRRRCVACQACVPACPMGIISSEGTMDGRPVLDFNRGFCQYNCFACQPSCPAGVFLPVPLDRKKRIRIARTAFTISRCVVLTQGTACGACAEVCPTFSLVMVKQDREGLPTKPDFDPEPCIGCGACWHVCPAMPRAFAITPLRRHEEAGEPRLPPSNSGADASREEYDDGAPADFPF
ncbi:MAG: 4Fe-4S dicluster domain-containing protein [Planctomycetota bacterium]|jgi:ferredoxin|nr:4Fe-4S dicluster domain-containing protein [Planctomycetota bacterium]